MGCLMRTVDMGAGKAKGTRATKPCEVDDILHVEWDEITNGDPRDLKLTADQFMKKHVKHIFNMPEFQIDKLNAEKFKEICRINTDSAAGLDGWAARDIALLSSHMSEVLVGHSSAQTQRLAQLNLGTIHVPAFKQRVSVASANAAVLWLHLQCLLIR